MWEWCVGAAKCRRHSGKARNDSLCSQVAETGGHNDILRLPVSPQSSIRILAAMNKEEAVYRDIQASCESLGYLCQVVTSLDQCVSTCCSYLPHVVVVDLRCKSFRGDQICRAIRSMKRSHHVILVALRKKPSLLEKSDDKEIRGILKMGFNKIIYEQPGGGSGLNWTLELQAIEQNDVYLRNLLAHNETAFCALDKSRDLVYITNQSHVIQYVNKSCCSVLGYSQDELLHKFIANFHQLGQMDQIIRQLDRGFDWEGKVSWKCKNGDSIPLHCKALPFCAFGRDPTHFIYIQENPLDFHNLPRGSVPSIRKGSYDLKSINSEGAQSARRQSLAKLHNLPLEAPITKVISLISAAQEHSSDHVINILDKVIDILRTTELYSSHVKAENLRCEDPVTSDLIGALISQGPAHVSTTRRSSNDSANVKSHAHAHPHSHAGGGGPGGGAKSLNMVTSPQMKELLTTSLAWDFNIFKLEHLSNKRPLVHLGMNLLTSHYAVHKTLGIDERTLYNWLHLIEKNYHSSNTYHNSTHASDVLQAVATFLEKEKLNQILDELDEACCLIAAIVHDIDHPGKSSAFLCNAGNDLALLYNDISVLESHHSALTFKLTLREEKANIFKGLERDTYKVARQSIIDMVLATEMTKHFEHLAKFVSVFNTPSSQHVECDYTTQEPQARTPSSDCGADDYPVSSPEAVNLVRRMLIKCADVANPTRPLPLCVEWGRRIAEEYFTQTDEEKALKLPVVMPMFDRVTCSIPKSQMGFVDFIINDMFEAWDAFIDMPEMLYHLRSNYQYWKDMDEKGVTSIQDIYPATGPAELVIKSPSTSTTKASSKSSTPSFNKPSIPSSSKPSNDPPKSPNTQQSPTSSSSGSGNSVVSSIEKNTGVAKQPNSASGVAKQPNTTSGVAKQPNTASGVAKLPNVNNSVIKHTASLGGKVTVNASLLGALHNASMSSITNLPDIPETSKDGGD